MQNTANLSPADTLIFAPVAGSLSLATRRLAGSSFRPYAWPTDEHGCAAAAAQFALKVGFPLDRCNTLGVTIGRTPRANRTNLDNPALPSRVLLVAVALADAEGVAVQPYLDRAFDLLAGLCGVKGCASPMMIGALSQHGFGFTMPPLRRPTALRVAAAFRIDGILHKCRAALNRAQERNAEGALRVLAMQWAQEANDPTMHPLDRARRVAAVMRIDPTAGQIGFGRDSTGEALDLYARDCAATDDGSEAWERFATASDRSDEAANDAAGGSVEGDAASDAYAADDRSDDDAEASETELDKAERQNAAAKAAQRASAKPARTAKAQREREADEAAALTQAAAADCAFTVGKDAEGGVNVAKSLAAARARFTIS